MSKKSLNDILKGNNKSTVTTTSIGSMPGVDYKPKDEMGQKFVNIHDTEKYGERVDDNDDLFKGTNIKYSLDAPENKFFGNKRGKDIPLYGEKLNKKTLKDVTTKADKVTEETVEESKVHPKMKEAIGDVDGLWNDDYHTRDKYNMGVKRSGPYSETIARVAHKHGIDPDVLRREHDKSMFPLKYQKEDVDNLKEENPAYIKTNDQNEQLKITKAELKAIADKSMHMVMHLNNNTHLAPWVQDNVSKAHEHINTVHDHMVYGKETKENE